MKQVVESEGVSSKTEFEDMGMELFALWDSVVEGTGLDERGEGEGVGGEGMLLEHVGVEEEDGMKGGLVVKVGFEESVEEEGVGVGKGGEETESVVEVAVVVGEGAEADDGSDGVVVRR